MKSLMNFIIEKNKINENNNSLSIDNIFPPEKNKDFWKDCKWAAYEENKKIGDDLSDDYEPGEDDWYHHIYTYRYQCHLVIKFVSKDIIEFYGTSESRETIRGTRVYDNYVTFKLNKVKNWTDLDNTDDLDFDWDNGGDGPDIDCLLDFLRDKYKNNEIKIESEKDLCSKFNVENAIE